MTATATAPRLTREQRSRQLGRQGYSISESIVTIGVFFIGRPNGEDPYTVDIAGGTCTCMDFCQHGAPCKHQLFVNLCARWWTKLAAMQAAMRRSRRRFSTRHLAQFRALAPTFAAPAPAPVETSVSRRPITREEIARRAAEDF